MTAHRRPALMLAALLIALAIVLRAALPLGWMPVQTQDGIRVLLCSGKGTIELVIPRAGDHTPDSGKSDQPRDPCPFASLFASDLDPPSALDVAAMPPIASAKAAPESLTARLVAARAIRPPARGPPTFA